MRLVGVSLHYDVVKLASDFAVVADGGCTIYLAPMLTCECSQHAIGPRRQLPSITVAVEAM